MKKLFSLVGKIFHLAFSDSGKATGIVFASNILASALGFVATLFATRTLGPSNFGVLSTSIALMTTIVGLTDFGLATTGIRFIAEYLHNNHPRAMAVLKVIWRLEIWLGVFILLAGALFTPLIARSLGDNGLRPMVYLSFIGAFGLSVAVFYNIVFQAYQKYFLFSIVGIINGTARLAVLLFLFWTHRFSLQNVLLAYSLTPLFSLVVCYFLMPREFLKGSQKEVEKQVIPQLLHFGKWTMVSFVALSIVGRFDILALKRYTASADVGVYGAAIQLATVLPILIGSITSVLLPKASRIESYEHLIKFAKKSLLSSTVIFVLILPIFLFSGPLIRLVFGPEYLPSIPVFRILFWGFMISLFTNPLSVIVFRLNKPNYASYGNLAQFVVGLTLYLTLVPRYGLPGAAWANFFVSVTGFSVILAFMYSIFLKKNAARVEQYLASSQA